MPDRIAQTPAHDQGGLVRHVEHEVHPVRGDPGLRRAHQVVREKPLVQRYLGPLQRRADRDGELAAATIALKRAGTSASSP